MECYGGEESAQTSLGPKRMRQNSAYLLLYERVSTNEKDMPGDGIAEDDLHGIIDDHFLKPIHFLNNSCLSCLHF